MTWQRLKIVGRLIALLCALGLSAHLFWLALHPGIRTEGWVVNVADGTCAIRYEAPDGTTYQAYDHGGRYSRCDEPIGTEYDVWFAPGAPEDAQLNSPWANAAFGAAVAAFAITVAVGTGRRLRRGDWHTPRPRIDEVVQCTPAELEDQFPLWARAERLAGWLDRHLRDEDRMTINHLLQEKQGEAALEQLLDALSETSIPLSVHESRLLRDLIEPRDNLSLESRARLAALVARG